MLYTTRQKHYLQYDKYIIQALWAFRAWYSLTAP